MTVPLPKNLFKTAKAKTDSMSRGDTFRQLKKVDEELRVVWGEVYAPDVPDSQGDWMAADAIREMAWNFMRKMVLDNVDESHTRTKKGNYVVESFIARDDDKLFIPGSWVVGVKVANDDDWDAVKKGELNGFSLDGQALGVATEIEIEIPDVVKGETTETEDHKHVFMVKFDDDGAFIGGTTDEVNGHVHVISKGTVTDEAAGHTHRFSVVEGLEIVSVSYD